MPKPPLAESIVLDIESRTREGQGYKEIGTALGLSDTCVCKYRRGLLRKIRKNIPPTRLWQCEQLLEYAPTCSAHAGPWLADLPHRQFQAVWKAVAIEQLTSGCNGADALKILQAAEKQFVKVDTHGRNRPGTRGNASPYRTA